MLKRFLNGIVFGAGFGIAFIALVVIYFQFFFRPTFERKIDSSNELTGTPPAIRERQRFLGSAGVYSMGFSRHKNKVLTSGPGKIIGEAKVNGKPVVGLRLRLALNGSVMSQWVTTDSNGQYVISVPHGMYRIDGYDLDSVTANAVLANKTDHPLIAHSSDTFEVSDGTPGRGLSFKFIDPIIKDISKKKFSLSEEIVIAWKPYPGASQYLVQIHEKSDPHEFVGNKTLFGWSDRPEVSENFINLKEHNVDLKAGHFYVVEVAARGDDMRIISRTERGHVGYDFEVVE